MKLARTLPLTVAMLATAGVLHAQTGGLPSLGEERAPMGTQPGPAPGEPGLQPRDAGQGLAPRQPAYDTAPSERPGLRPGPEDHRTPPDGMRGAPDATMPGMTPPAGMQPGQMGPGGIGPATPPAGGTPPGQPGFGRQ